MDVAQIANDMNIAESMKSDQVANPKATLSKDDFLKLLVAQLKYQDPLHPLNNDQFIQENTMFSQLEQLMNMSKSINSMVDKFKSNPRQYAATYLGKYISTGENDINVSNSKIDPIGFNLSKEAKVVIHISNSKGEDIADIDLGKLQPGSHTYTWNGKDNQGNSVPNGTYSVRITAEYDDGTQITLSKSVGKVVSVRFEGDKTILITDSGRTVNLSDVVSVSEGG
ncbi:flagellar hook assembly protein FlgD [Hippea alviniae]|uniref:flagellar hook assembly protein FlgD n=1 Tax=Hippea alviniae TaxID=1279027 RepID=UPI0003B2E7B7|nr:flagellar hook assembly protein FlgD [Hippea alviniae]